MTMTIDTIPLPAPSPGTRRELKVRRYGAPGARPKVYLQAAIHADEWPGLMALHHLARRLDDLHDTGAITGEIILVPYANPIGLAQGVNDRVLGRYALMDGGANFNREWPDLTDAVHERVADKLGADAATNVALVRDALIAAVAALPGATEVTALKKALLGLSIDADVVLDVHCDSEATVHLYGLTVHRAQLEDLGADVAAPVILLEEDAGGDPFDTANSGPWVKLKQRLGEDIALPPACFACTVELRGRADVSNALGERDAEGLLNHLRRVGAVDGPVAEPEGPRRAATPLEAVDVVKAPAAGLVSYLCAPGDEVTTGQIVAEIIDITADDANASSTLVSAATDGLVFSVRSDRLTRPGATMIKIAGRAPLANRRAVPQFSRSCPARLIAIGGLRKGMHT